MGLRSLALRTSGEPAALVPLVRRNLETIDARFLVRSARTLSDQVDLTISQERILTRLCAAFGALGLFLVHVVDVSMQ